MKRSEFLAEVGKSLFKTVQEASAPLVLDQVNKIDCIVDDLTGIRWHEVGSEKLLTKEGLHDLFISGKAITIIYDKESFKAIEKVCLSCNMMLQWIAYEKKFKCMSCEADYVVPTKSGKLTFNNYPTQIKEGRLYVGIR